MWAWCRRYHKLIADREAARLEKLRRNTIEDFVEWLRNPDPVHRNAVFMEIYDIAARKTPITLTAIQDIVERETPLLVQEFDTLHPDDRECIDHLWKVWLANRKRIVRGTVVVLVVGCVAMRVCSHARMRGCARAVFLVAVSILYLAACAHI